MNGSTNNKSLEELLQGYEKLISTPNHSGYCDGVCTRYQNPVLTRDHAPVFWRFDMDQETNPNMVQTFGINATFNSGAVKWGDEYVLAVRVEAANRKSFFALARSKNPVEGFRFDNYPIILPKCDLPETNVYDMRLTAHEDGWLYGIFCSERHDESAPKGDLGAAIASAGIIRTKDLVNWERLPNIKASHHQRNVTLHPEFVNGKYALYTRPQDDFITAGYCQGICWSLIDDISNSVITEERVVDHRFYHTIKEAKNGEGPSPIKTPKGWLHLAHGVRACAAGYRYVLYSYVSSLEDPAKVIAAPAGYLLAPLGNERVGDVSNVLFCNGWICDDDGTIYIYYASSDTRLHVATTTVDILLDYCFKTEPDGLTSSATVDALCRLIKKNLNGR